MRHVPLIGALAAWSMACLAFAQTGSNPVELIEGDPLFSDQAPLPASGEAPLTQAARSEDDLVLAQVRLGRQVLADGLPGYVERERLLLPLGALSEILQFPIRVSAPEGRADGWFLARDRRFSLDVGRREAIVGSDRLSFEPHLVELMSDDIYVDTVLLSKWFPLEFDFVFATQTLTVRPRGGVLLPVQGASERERRRALLNLRDKPEIPLPRARLPYRLYSLPFADVTWAGGADSQDNRGWRNDLSVLAGGDLFTMHSRIYLSANEAEGVQDFRWTLSRRDPEGKLFSTEEAESNPLARWFNRYEVRELALGDVYTQQAPLTAFNQLGRGLMISTKPYDRATQFNRTTLQGDLPPGWDVELYRNDELLDFRRTAADGRYEFIDVPLLSGLNILRLVFHGPFGQTREETQRFLVSPDIAQAGKGYFQASLTQQDSSLFDLRRTSSVSGFGVTPSEREVVHGKPRLMMEYEYGLTGNVSLFSNFVHLTTGDDEKRNYASLGAATSLAGAYLRLDVARDVTHSGNAFELLAEDNLFGVSLSARHQQFHDFISEFTESVNDPLTSRTTLRADTPVELFFLPRVNTGIIGLRQTYESGRERLELSERQSAAISGVALSHLLTWRRDQSPGLSATKEILSDLIVSLPWREVMLRGNVVTRLAPQRTIDTLALAAEYRLDRETLARLDVNRQMGDAAITTYTTSLNRRFEHVMLGISASHSDDGNRMIGFTVSFSAGVEPRNGDWHIFPDYAADDGFVSARAFHDINANGVWDDQDSAIGNVRFQVDGGMGGDPAGADGVALLRNIPPDLPARITLDESSLEDPYLVAAVPGAEIVPRAGVPAVLDIPVVGAADLEGTAYLISGGAKKPAANVELQLVDANGKIVRETRSAFDGYYLIDTLPVGGYRLRLSPGQRERLGLEDAAERPVQVTGESDTIVVDFTVRR